MACSAVTTPGASNATSYCSVAEADAYFESSPFSETWDAATDDEKCRALVTATRLLDEQFDWFGSVVTSLQKLLWPRNGMRGRNGFYVEDTVIPQDLKEMTAQLASDLLDGNRTADNTAQTDGILSFKAGPIEATFKNPTGKVLPDAVIYGLAHYGTPRDAVGGDGMIRLERA